MLSAASTPSAACAVPTDRAYELVLTPPAVRAVASGLPEAVAAAVIEFMTSALVDAPRRVGKPFAGRPGRNPVGAPRNLPGRGRIGAFLNDVLVAVPDLRMRIIRRIPRGSLVAQE